MSDMMGLTSTVLSSIPILDTFREKGPHVG